MKIIKSGKVICELPEEPKNFDGGCKGVKVWMTVGDDEIVLSHYESHERASEVIRALHDAYFSGADEFDLA
ncbi:MAG: hypothetical protein IJK81_13545 [Selenomonadaceae bacterium]|nr:hypothetical protein [Selenomonadaceae bacterium]